MKTTIQKVNVAPQSTKGHFVTKAICIDSVKEAFVVQEDCMMTSENHGETPIAKNSLTIPQQVFNPFSKAFERSID